MRNLYKVSQANLTLNKAKIAYSSKKHLVGLVGMFDSKISKTCAMSSEEIWVERK
jgi:hypothetical protein